MSFPFSVPVSTPALADLGFCVSVDVRAVSRELGEQQSLSSRGKSVHENILRVPLPLQRLKWKRETPCILSLPLPFSGDFGTPSSPHPSLHFRPL